MPLSLRPASLALSCALALFLVAGCTGPSPPAAPSAPRTATAEKRGSEVEMPKELGGVRLGMSVADFAGICGAKGAKSIPNERDQTIMCTLPPEPLLPRAAPVSFDGVVVGAFCGAGTGICELIYVVYGKRAERDDQIRALLADLTRRYGPPTTSEGYAGSDPGRECTTGKSALHFMRSWSFGAGRHPVGRIRLVFDCDPQEPEREAPLTLLYDDEAGLARSE
jgi:hypothetical protein